MLSRVPMLFVGHPWLALVMLVIAAFVIRSWGHEATAKAIRICRQVLFGCLVLWALDVPLYWWSKGLNRDGYATIYPIILAILLIPFGASSAVVWLVLRLSSPRSEDGDDSIA